MATYFLLARYLSRGKGARVTRAAAYRAGERIRDERTGEVHNFSDRHDVVHKEIVVPADLAARADMMWTRNRGRLWNAAEFAGRQRNSRLAREWLVLFPTELNAVQRTQLARRFAAELAEKYRCAVDLCVHTPRPGADRRHHHAHLLMTTREVTPDGLGPRIGLELNGHERHEAGLGSSKDEFLRIRERWAELTNEALREAGHAARVDHRSLAAQGINREPALRVPEKVFYQERKTDGPSRAGDAIRARHRERVYARLKSEAELTRVVERQKAELRQRAREDFKQREAQPKRIRWNALTREERNERLREWRREYYRRRRELEKQDPVRQARQREVMRLRYHARMKESPEAVREQRRRYRNAHKSEVNRYQREYRRAHKDELNRKQRERFAAGAALRQSRTSSPTPEESLARWRAYRESHGPGPTPEGSLRRWLARRDVKQANRSASAARTRDPAREGASADGNTGSRKSSPGRDRGGHSR